MIDLDLDDYDEKDAEWACRCDREGTLIPEAL